MQSLKRFFKPGSRGNHTPSGQVDDRMVLPRPLRFFRRYLSRIINTSMPVPAGMGSVLAIGFLALTIGYGVYAGGHSDVMVSSAASSAGLTIDAIKISGQVETSEVDVLTALDLGARGSLLGLDLRQARERLINLDWVEDVSVRKLFPDRLEISLVEKRPFALWQQDQQLSVVETNGNIITKLSGVAELSANHVSLPRIVGDGAEKRAAKLFDLVSAYPSIYSRVASYVRVSDRRWDILLRNDIVIQLPEAGESVALDAVVKLDRERQLLSRQIDIVDMRLSDRMVLRVMPDAAAKRQKFVKQRAKRMRKAEKSI